MHKIDTKTNVIYVTRGENMYLPFKIKDYIFSIGDIIEFKIYGEMGLTYKPMKVIKHEVKEITDIVYISLSSEDTDLFPLNNKPITYWYEIDLNNKNVVLGYDLKGPKKIVIYPKGMEIKEVIEDE